MRAGTAFAVVVGSTVGTLSATGAQAQVIGTRASETVIPFSYERGRNESVQQRYRPDYTALGVKAGGFTLYPTLETNIGFTDNAYQIEDKTSDAFLAVNPTVRLSSDWSRHNLQLEGGGRLVRFFNETDRNEDGWFLTGQGKVDVSSSGTLNFGANTARLYESRFSGAALQNVRTSTPYQSSIVKFLGDYRFNRVRTVLTGDYSFYDFKTVRTFDGGLLNQDNRDRELARVAGHVEYGLTPDAGAFAQLIYTDTTYKQRLSRLQQNRDSTEVRALAGISLDLSALVRGSFGIGYIDRRYESPLFGDVAGFSMDGRIEYFMTPLTTITLAARRDIEDATFGGASGFFNTGAALRVDHELLRNLILNIGADYEVDDYRGVDGTAKILRIGGGGRYLINNLLAINVTAEYGKRDSDGFLTGAQLSEFRALGGVTIHR
jgi:hypothetical protein